MAAKYGVLKASFPADDLIASARVNAVLGETRVLRDRRRARRGKSDTCTKTSLDAFGHVSVRHPADGTHFFSRVRAVRNSSPTTTSWSTTSRDARFTPTAGRPYIERFIHAAIYAARPDVAGVVHSHADDVIPFSITARRCVPVLHTARVDGGSVPVWDIRERFGDRTNLLVATLEQGRDLARDWARLASC